MRIDKLLIQQTKYLMNTFPNKRENSSGTNDKVRQPACIQMKLFKLSIFQLRSSFSAHSHHIITASAECGRAECYSRKLQFTRNCLVTIHSEEAAKSIDAALS